MKINLQSTPVLAAIVFLLAAFGSHSFAQTVTQTPLQVNVNVPGNLALVPSVEWPTINSVANLGDYDAGTLYAGYFDPRKCYQYIWNTNEPLRHFRPIRTTSNQTCTAADAPWSGNFLNWAATQTIDPFRSALTGGFRVRDTATETWLEKARHDGQGGTDIFPNRRLPASGANRNMLQGATPFTRTTDSQNFVVMRIQGLGNQMRIRIGSTSVDNNVIAFNPASSNCFNNSCELSIRVAVCVPGLLEPNCVQYRDGWKPEGTLQANANSMRYSVFSYLNDSDGNRDGGVMRASKKFIGPVMPDLNDPLRPLIPNPRREWDATTGILIQNPDPTDATNTTIAVGRTIQFSGVINYLNRFGQMTTNNHKSFDPVSELFYAASRYFRNLGNVPQYSNLSGSADNRFNHADGFPVITTWNDPILYWCQPNTILGIGDIYTHRDKNLPGNTVHRSNEPAMPSLVSQDTINVLDLTRSVATMEGITINLNEFTGRQNSAFMAGLAWDLRSRDIRPDLTGGPVHVSTYWVDVLEAQSLEGVARNQYVLATKYGGARLPPNFNRNTWNNQPLPQAWWHTNNETLTPFGSRGNGQPPFRRPDNFFLAENANQMVDSLQRAFRSILAESTGSGVSLAANSTELSDGNVTFQAQFFSGSWRGELNAFDVNKDTGELSVEPKWQAGSQLPNWSSRNIFFHNGSGVQLPFTWGNIPGTQRTLLGSEAIVNYLRGDRSQEQPVGTLRTRTGALGHIVHSRPVLVKAPDPQQFVNTNFTGLTAYSAFVTAQQNRSPVIYVGSNGGMLHGFNANTGVETYAFVPAQVINNNLRSLADPFFVHRFFVDGEIATADVFINGNWRTVLIGTLGRGGPGIFALDVTNPNSVQFLWEKTASDIAALGRNIGQPVIAQVADGDWRVILGNGPDNASGSAQLVSIRISNGVVSTINTGATGNNGLSAVHMFDSNNDGFMDAAYAGDLRGNIWRFNNISGTGSAQLLFQARDSSNNPQPVTAAPFSTINPDNGNRWVFFGTGKFLNELDPASTQVQTWYGIIDSGSTIADRTFLRQRNILAEGTIGAFGARVIAAATPGDMVGASGWFIDLVSPNSGAEGERMVVPNLFEKGRLIGTTRIPDATDLCRPSGRGFVMAIDPFTGARLPDTFFDINRDNIFNDGDKLLVGGVPTVISGIGFRSSPNNPNFVDRFMQVSLDDGTIEIIGTPPPPPPPPPSSRVLRRTGWREILGN